MEEELDQTQDIDEPKKTDKKPELKKKRKISPIFYVLLTVALMVTSALAVWYYMNNQQDKSNKADQDTIGILRSNVSDLNKQLKNNKSTTSSAASTTTLKNELDSLRTFCKGTESDNIVGYLQYAENTNGKFGYCVVGKQQSEGAMLIANYSDSKWSRIWSGNGAMDLTNCTKYKLPTSIYADCTGNY